MILTYSRYALFGGYIDYNREKTNRGINQMRKNTQFIGRGRDAIY